MRTLLTCTLLAGFIGGCANFQAVSEFSEETGKLTATVRSEFSQVEDLCAKRAELVIVVNNIRDEGPLEDCRQFKAAQGRLASVTLDVLTSYARALASLADNKTLDVSSDLRDATNKLHGLRNKSGAALASPKEVGALSQVVEALLEVATAARREAAVKRLVQEIPNLAISGNVLRSYFVNSSEAPAGRLQAPYANLVALMNDSIASTAVSLRGPALRQAEPIRTAELHRELRVRKDLLQRRTGTSADSVPGKPIAAIDSWQSALVEFSDAALKPEPRNLLSRLKDLREKAMAARLAVAGAHE